MSSQSASYRSLQFLLGAKNGFQRLRWQRVGFAMQRLNSAQQPLQIGLHILPHATFQSFPSRFQTACFRCRNSLKRLRLQTVLDGGTKSRPAAWFITRRFEVFH